MKQKLTLFLAVMLSAMCFVGCAKFGKSRYSFTESKSSLPVNEIATVVNNMDPSITNIVDFTNYIFTTDFIENHVSFYDDQIVLNVVPNFSLPESYDKYKRETFAIYGYFCTNRLKGSLDINGKTVSCMSSDSLRLFSITNPNYTERTSRGNISYNPNMYVYIPTLEQRLGEAASSAVSKYYKMTTVVGVQGKSGNNELILDLRNKTLTFNVMNNFKAPLEQNYKNIPGYLETKEGIKYNVVYSHVDVNGAGCMLANDIVIINPQSKCEVKYVNSQFGRANFEVNDMIGGKMETFYGTFIFEAYTEYDRK